MRTDRTLNLLLLLLCLTAVLRAEDPPNRHVGVLDPATGKPLGHYLLMRSTHEAIDAGTEDPHFAYLWEFCFGERRGADKPEVYDRPDLNGGPDKTYLGTLPGEISILWFRKEGNYEVGWGPLKAVDAGGRQWTLISRTCYSTAGRSAYFHHPRLSVAGPFLLVEEDQGLLCKRIPDNKVLWRTDLKFNHYCRWNWGAWYRDGALYLSSSKGLVRVNPDTGKQLWTWPDAVEVCDLDLYPDGHLYVRYQYGPSDAQFASLRKAALDHYNWPGDFRFFSRIIPYKDRHFASVWWRKGELEGNYLKDGKQALWECVDGKWSFIFDYEVKGQSQEELDALFARHGFSPRMRKQLTTDSLETVYRFRGKPLPPPR